MERLKGMRWKDWVVCLLPAVITFGFNCFVYIAPRFLVSPERYVFLDMEIDRKVPFTPQFVIVYYLSFAQWANYYLQASFGPRERRDRYFSADMLGKAICFAVFLLWPVAMRWPDLPEDGGFWIWLLSFTYGVDAPNRALPSLHCFYSWIAFRYSLEAEPRERRWITGLQLAFSLTLFAATMLVKQHYFVDVVSGIAVAELALQIAGHTGLPEAFGRAMDGIVSRIAEKGEGDS